MIEAVWRAYPESAPRQEEGCFFDAAAAFKLDFDPAQSRRRAFARDLQSSTGHSRLDCTTGVEMMIAETTANSSDGTRGVRHLLGAITISIGALAAGAASAVPVRVPGTDGYSYAIEKSEVTGHSGGSVEVLGQEGYWQGNRYFGGGGLYANAWASYYFLGAASVSVGTLIWGLHFETPDRPLDLYIDWDVSIVTGSSAILGAAGGGGQLKVMAQQFYPGWPIPHTVGLMNEVYQDSATAGGVTYLGHIDPGEEWWLAINFLTGSTASTMSVVGIAAEADTFGFFSFNFWADDGTSPPVPVPEPMALWLLAGTLPLLGLAARRRPARLRIPALR